MSSPISETCRPGLSSNTSDSESVGLVSQQNLSIPQFWPHKIALWFRLLEAQFTSARISKDEMKFNITIANLGEQCVEHIDEIVLDPPATGMYEFLKQELMRRLSESDSSRVRKLLESEEIGNPSQFFHDLRKLATPSILDDFLLTLWKSRLPTNMQRVLAATTNKTITVLTEMTDRIHEIRPERGRIAQTFRKDEISALQGQIKQLKLHINALTRNRDRSLSRNKKRHRSRSRESFTERGNGNPDWCWCHNEYRNRAKKCRSPCT
nr:PREDICTED: uncharacterized protein LOC105661890 [Megachile rotundata]